MVLQVTRACPSVQLENTQLLKVICRWPLRSVCPLVVELGTPLRALFVVHSSVPQNSIFHLHGAISWKSVFHSESQKKTNFLSSLRKSLLLRGVYLFSRENDTSLYLQGVSYFPVMTSYKGSPSNFGFLRIITFIWKKLFLDTWRRTKQIASCDVSYDIGNERVISVLERFSDSACVISRGSHFIRIRGDADNLKYIIWNAWENKYTQTWKHSSVFWELVRRSWGTRDIL